MSRYRQKPEVVDAIQFTGGSKNAEEVIQWLKSNGAEDATWIDNQTVMDIHLVERLSFKTNEDTAVIRSAYRKDWIVRKANKWRIYSERQFRERFEKI